MRLAWSVSLLVVLGCSEGRTTGPSGGEHPEGWAVRTSANFHAKWLAANAFPLPRCQQCHGNDYGGGSVGVACTQSGCHTQPPIACTTCHGSNGTPRPDAGAHWAHEAYCSTCHTVPVETTASVQQHASQDASTLIHFGDIALQSPAQWLPDGGADAAPAWDPTARRCTNTYCHGGASPDWTGGKQIACSGCHEAPPKNHARWIRVAGSTDSCTTCHPSPTGPTHINGVVDVTVTSCTTCHGSNGHPNPPMSLDGSTDPTTRGVGAHQAHLDPYFPDRIASPLLCNDCHVVPERVMQPGHLDQPQTRVRFPFGGTYDPTTAQCSVWCHFNKTTGPVWTDNSGDAVKCDACHAFPPVYTRAGDPHPSVPGDLVQCVKCHPFSPTTHVNGVVDFLTP